MLREKKEDSSILIRNEDSPRVGVFTHTQYRDNKPVHGPSDDILDFMKVRVDGEIVYLSHSIYKGNGSVLEIYKGNELQLVKKNNCSKDFPNVLRYIVDLVVTFFWLIRQNRIRLVIAADPLNFLYAYVLKSFRKVDKIVYYTLDYAYRRFDNYVLNRTYHFLDRFAVNRSDLLWNACEKIREIRKNQKVDDRKNFYITNMPVLHNIKVKNFNEIDRFSLVIIFSDHKLVDFGILFRALPKLVKRFPKINLKLIGKGNFSRDLIGQIPDESLLHHVEFMDIGSHSEALEEVSRCAIGLECNTQSLCWNEFREPIKIMEYIAFGLPIISKPGHALVDKILEEEIGFVVRSSDELLDAVDALMGDSSYFSKVRRKVLDVAKKYDKQQAIYDSLSQLDEREHEVPRWKSQA